MALKSPIQYGNFQNGQGALGKLQQNKFTELTNVEIHNEIGIATCQFAMEVESATPNESFLQAIDPSGNIYGVSTESGKIWKRTTAGSWSFLHTNANGAHTGCQYFNGYLWYWTSTKLGSYDLASTYNDSVATGTAFRGSTEANNTLLIANGRYIARIDSANSVALQELVLPAQYKATALKNIGDDVLIGTYVSTDVAYCRVFLWDTVSTSWSYEDEIFEIGVNCFVQLDNIIVAQCGTSGRFYYWTGSQMAYFGKISGITTALGEQKAVTYNGRPLFANGTKIYSIHKEDSGLPFAFAGEYTVTSGDIASIFVQGQTLLASTGDGAEKKGTSYATAVIETPEAQGKVSEIRVKYDSYPAGIGISTNINGAGYVDKTPVVEPIEKYVTFNGGLVDGIECQVKITLTPSGANIPKIKDIILL